MMTTICWILLFLGSGSALGDSPAQRQSTFVLSVNNTVAIDPRQHELAREITKEARRQGLKFESIEISRQSEIPSRVKPFRTSITVTYTADTVLAFTLERLRQGRTHCFYDLAHAINTLRPRFTRPPFIVFVDWATDSIGIGGLSLFGPSGHTLELEEAASYPTREACETAREPTLRHYRDTLRRDALEAQCVCHFGAGSQYTVTLIENNTRRTAQ